jgi:hypothetical protein
MLKHGVRLTGFVFEFSWTQHGRKFAAWRLTARKYFSDYDGHDRIADARQLAEIEASGLSRRLEHEGLPQAKGGNWFEYPRQRDGTGYKGLLSRMTNGCRQRVAHDGSAASIRTTHLSCALR